MYCIYYDTQGSEEVEEVEVIETDIENVEIWIDEESRNYENTAADLCEQLAEAWICVEETLETLGPKQKLIMGMMMRGIRDAVNEICSRKYNSVVFL